jgi:hypothetical protein
MTILHTIASTITQTVPDLGATSVMLGLGLLSLGVAARVFKNRKR